MRIGRLALMAMLALALAHTAVAQRARGAARYNTGTEITVTGKVVEVSQQQCPTCPWTGEHMSLKAGDTTYDVHLGPTSYLAKQNVTFAKGDQVEVLGSKVKMNGKDVLLAREVKKGGATLTLRNASGKPLWSGGRRR